MEAAVARATGSGRAKRFAVAVPILSQKSMKKQKHLARAEAVVAVVAIENEVVTIWNRSENRWDEESWLLLSREKEEAAPS